MNYAAVFACSHRKGNTDFAAEHLAEGVRQAGGRAELIRIREFEILHCLACGACEKANGQPLEKRCVLTPRDQSLPLFRHFVEARSVLIASPIYFYSLPSRFKTLIDRSQQFWAARREKAPWLTDTPPRKATIALTAGRPKGARLFEGAELILKYFLDDYGITMAESLHFRGKDAPDALRNDVQAVERLREAGRNAWLDAV